MVDVIREKKWPGYFFHLFTERETTQGEKGEENNPLITTIIKESIDEYPKELNFGWIA